ncbi:hypothetical protein Mp_8g16340 [Marchantia polymorpha subsp. ruderalis]|uniref:Glutamyl-tRNA(Gln) amidotransferase subunit C, chloroplastic/mitochondrial n=2 Tax=Marchantia polymorpha TaxID=3197 RepID=A0A176VF92_MARPO|nr:hypothetical protein AXG93_960s1310 [Marchantia polymorpha subsp. ruderalis]PTQ28804.1 hypothetical protein MARPO_0154s0030 [Marchantia polymorpha]BBN20089.1 hypothetical protein Mp_8g16340 [Marchantia polymorpha subsp. ruderalis]|eukprot:PTQ28804.1 hypothetical protein MARPO_0154s0030 [Marchantia polymorpha]
MMASSSSSAALLAHARLLPRRLPPLSPFVRPCSASSASSSSTRQVEPPNLAQLCDKARISLSAKEIEEFSPQISKVVDWFAQLQDVDVENIEPAIRVGALDGKSALRADTPVIFEERETMIASLPDREGPYMRVPKILKENVE